MLRSFVLRSPHSNASDSATQPHNLRFPIPRLLMHFALQVASSPRRRSNPAACATAAAALALVVAQAVVPASAAVTSLSVVSEAGDWVGRGEPYFYTPAEGTFTIVPQDDGGIWAYYMEPGLGDWWIMGFAAPYGAPLAVGHYPSATRYPFQQPGMPGLDVEGNGRGCNVSRGEFHVVEIAYGGSGAIASLRVRFEQYCDGRRVPLRGELRFNAEVHAEMSAPLRVVGPAGSALTLEVAGTALDGGPLALEALDLPEGAAFSDHGNGTGRLMWTPAPDQVGAHAVTFAGRDSLGGSDSVTTDIRVGVSVHVPADYPSIQGAIEAVPFGSEVIVSPGTYTENLEFLGKPIRLVSEAGPEATIIDGGGVAPVVLFWGGERRDSVLDGFTLRNGYSEFSGPYASNGAGILVAASSPAIINNIVKEGRSCDGCGIGVELGAPLIQANVIKDNLQWGCSGGGGGGIFVVGYGRAEILHNEIRDNTTHGSGGGLLLQDTSRPKVIGNTILRNFADEGGGIYVLGESGADIVGNLVAENRANDYGGVAWFTTWGVLRPRLANNTIAGNDGRTISGLYPYGIDPPPEVVNNIIVGVEGQPAVECYGTTWLDTDRFRNNNVFNPNGPAYGATCENPTGRRGNMSVDPEFQCVDLNDYRPGPASGVIDAGDDSIPGLPTTELWGSPRSQDGDGDGTATIDLGAYEFDPAAPVDHCVYLTCPADIDATAPQGRATATVTYAVPGGSPGSTVSCVPPSGGAFPGGTTSVTCTATDSEGHTDSCSFSIAVTVRPLNDDVTLATRIRALPFADRIDVREATSAPGDPDCVSSRPTVWYTYTPPRDVILVADTVGSSYLATVGAFVEEQGASRVLACGQGPITVTARARQTIRFAIGSEDGGGDLSFSLLGRPPLKIQVAPDRMAHWSQDGTGLVLGGSTTCSRPATIALTGILRGWNGRPQIEQAFSGQSACSGRSRWEITIPVLAGAADLRLASVDISVEAEDQRTGDRAVARTEGAPVLISIGNGQMGARAGSRGLFGFRKP
jgi:parallel beta-helix repeat protein